MSEQTDPPETETRISRWRVWLETPFAQWLYGTALVGLLGFAYTNYSTCRTQLATDEERANRIYEEYRVRLVRLRDAQTSQESSPKPFMTRIKEAVDPDRGFIFSEFKGKNFGDLHSEIGLLTRKWNIRDREPWHSLRLYHNNIVVDMAAYIHEGNEGFVKRNEIQTLYFETDFHRFGKSCLARALSPD